MSEILKDRESSGEQSAELISDSWEKRERSKEEIEKAKAEHSAEREDAKQEVDKVFEDTEEQSPVRHKHERQPSASSGTKKQQYKTTMRRTQAQLPVVQRAFSKFVHSAPVEVFSAAAGKTIARPSGLLGGAMAAFIGLAILYFNSRNIGFEYPTASAFIFFLSVGWLSGVLAEYIVVAFKRMFKKR